MTSERDALLEEIRSLLAADAGGEPLLPPEHFALPRAEPRPAPEPAPAPVPETIAVAPAAAEAGGALGFGIMFFSAAAEPPAGGGLYDFLLAAAERADRLGLDAVWLPERHFDPFGGPYPAPAVLLAAVAARTKRIRLRSGSVILPLHHPVRVAEAFAVVDNLSRGRVELGLGSGWNPRDFLLSPADFAGRKEVLEQRLDQVLRLWRGEELAFTDGRGEEALIRIHPRPCQASPPIWIASTGSLDTFRWAGTRGYDILTMVLGGDLVRTGAAITAYREARAAAGHDPAAGRVALMLHTLVHPDRARVEAEISEPFGRYVRQALESQRGATEEGRSLDEAQRAQMAAYATQRYARTAALFGPAEDCLAMLRQVKAAGVDEVACLVDFGVPDALALDGIDQIARLRELWRQAQQPAAPTVPERRPAAVIGIGLRLPGATSLPALGRAITAGAPLLGPAPAGRFKEAEPSLGRAGFLDEIELFDAAAYGLAPAEAATIDPHHRLLLQVTSDALADAGLTKEDLRGGAVGVFTALYSTSFSQRRGAAAVIGDGLDATGAIHSMAPNRISHLFDWAGPSEIVATACSSGLVALHRALKALQAGECELALVAGASLLLSDAESLALRRLGLLSASDSCRAFAADADGQVRGEGAVALLLRPLPAALAAGDPIHAQLLGSATNHAGGGSGSLTLPNTNRQAACIRAALADAGVGPGEIGYVEAHGAGSPAGDAAELAAMREAWAGTASGEERTAIGSIKPLIGALDAAGGLAGVLAALLAVEQKLLPGLAAPGLTAEHELLQGAALGLNPSTRSWQAAGPRRALVHAYGLGGVNADIVLAAAPEPAMTASAAGVELVTLSARTAGALARTAQALAAHLRAAGASAPSLADIAFTLRVGRDLLAVRRQAEVKDMAELLAFLDAVGRSEIPAGGEVSRQLPVTPGAKRVFLPAPADDPLRFLLDGGRPGLPAAEEPEVAAAPAAVEGGSVVANFYDYVTRPRHARFEETYLTLAPFPDPEPGFSWTSCMQDPAAHAEHHALMLERQREMRRVALARVDLGRARRMMDIGCGLGTDLITLARAHPELLGTGYTLSPEQAQAAGRRIASLGLADRLTVLCRDSSRTPFPPDRDLIIGYEVVHHVPDKEGLFANIAKALAPDGHLVLADTIAGTVAPVSLGEVGSYTLPRADYADLFSRHGLKITQVVDLSQEIANFLHDPALDRMLASEERVAVSTGRGQVFRTAAAVQRSWHAFGEALREGLMLYVLVDAVPAPGEPDLVAINRSEVGA